MIVICCGKKMGTSVYEPDQDEAFIGFDCADCGASFYGKFKNGENKKEDKDG